MDQSQIDFRRKLAAQLLPRLEKRKFEASFAETADQAREEVLAMIPEGASVFRCGTMTLGEMGFWEEVVKLPGVELIDPYIPGISPQESLEIRRRGMSADIMIASSNAITLDGRLVNLDATGNRVAAMCFGPKKVILVVGMNKVAADLESAKQRVKHWAAPMNAIRLNLETPCTKTGLCADCNSPKRICNMWTVHEGHMIKDRIHVKLVGQDLGY